MKKKCEDMAPLISAYLDGEGSETDRHEAEKHLEECENCQKFARELNITGQFIKEALLENVESEWRPDFDCEGTGAQIDIWGTIRERVKRLIEKPIVWMPAAVAAAAMVLMLFSLPFENSKAPVEVSKVESVFSRSGKVMILQTGKTGQPIIWILPEKSTSG